MADYRTIHFAFNPVAVAKVEGIDMMRKSFYVHGNNLAKKMAKPTYPKVLDEVYKQYLRWKASLEKLNSENDDDLKLEFRQNFGAVLPLSKTALW